MIGNPILSIIFMAVSLPFVISTETSSPPTNPPRIQIFTRSSAGLLEETDQKEVNNYTTSVIFTQEMNSVELHCSSFYPVRWEFVYKGISLPVIDVHYKRFFKPVSTTNDSSEVSLDYLRAEANNKFLAIIRLEKHLQSQNGRYVCSHFNSKLLNNSHGSATSVNVFVPGNMTFYEVSHVQFVNSSAVSSIIIPCTVTDPSVNVKLFRLNEHIYKLRRQFSWKKIDGGHYDPMKGFELQGGLGWPLLGDYSCSTEDSHINISVVDVSEKTSLETEFGVRKPCWEDSRIMKMLRSKRLECFCRDSYALFSTDDEESNRKGNCPLGIPSLGNETEGGLQLFEKCKPDWRTLEFLGTEESNNEQEVCYRDSIRENVNGTGTRFFIRVKRRKTTDGKLNLTVRYDGSPTWADGFKLAVKVANQTRLLPDEPRTHKYPLAHFTATWENLIVGKDAESVFVFQPLPHDYEWFLIVQHLKLIDDERDGDEGYDSISTSAFNRGCNERKVNTFIMYGLELFVLIVMVR